MHGPAELAATVARNMRRHREVRRLSLSELAARAGVAKSTLSGIEGGRANPSMETLWAVATALGVPFGELVQAAPPSVRVLRAGEGTRIDSEGSPMVVRLLAATGRRGAAELYVMACEPGPARRADPHPEGMREHLLVTTGSMRVGPASDEVVLGPGDLATFAADVPHSYEALEPGTAAVALMDYP